MGGYMIRTRGRWADRFSRKRAEDDVSFWVDPDAGNVTAGPPEDRDSSPEEENEETKESAPEKKSGAQERIRGLVDDVKTLKAELETERGSKAQLERKLADLENEVRRAAATPPPEAPKEDTGNGDGWAEIERVAEEDNWDAPTKRLVKTIFDATSRGAMGSLQKALQEEVDPLRNVVLRTLSDSEMNQLRDEYGRDLVDKHETTIRQYSRRASDEGRYLTLLEVFNNAVPLEERYQALQEKKQRQERLRNEADTLDGGPDRNRDEDAEMDLDADQQAMLRQMEAQGADEATLKAMRRGRSSYE